MALMMLSSVRIAWVKMGCPKGCSVAWMSLPVITSLAVGAEDGSAGSFSRII